MTRESGVSQRDALRYTLALLVVGSLGFAGIAVSRFLAGSNGTAASSLVVCVLAASAAARIYRLLRRPAVPSVGESNVYGMPPASFEFAVAAIMMAAVVGAGGGYFVGGVEGAVVGAVLGALVGAFGASSTPTRR